MTNFVAALAALPNGTFYAAAGGRRYIATKLCFAGGKSVKLVAEELGGSDYISLNWYDAGPDGRLKPCEMSEAKVRTFVETLEVEAP